MLRQFELAGSPSSLVPYAPMSTSPRTVAKPVWVQSLLDWFESQGLLATVDGVGAPDEVARRVADAVSEQIT